jgi:cyclopropane-fatty-acyl-phospholipid synthase
LSKDQFDWARNHSPKGVEVNLENWYDHSATSRYDAIISIGAFEHFASYGQTRRQRVSCYREFFIRCRDWLPRGGRISLQTMTKGNNVQLDRRVIADLEFVINTIFPDSELPWLSELLEASEKAFDVVTLRNDPDHYARTCRAWLENLRGQRLPARDLVGDEVVANYERYLDVCAEQFSRRHLGLVRIVLERS